MSRNDGETVVFRHRLRISEHYKRMVFIMSYDVFCKRVNDVVKRAGSAVKFSREGKKHIARCSDGVTIIGSSECTRVFIKWGSGHTAYAVI